MDIPKSKEYPFEYKFDNSLDFDFDIETPWPSLDNPKSTDDYVQTDFIYNQDSPYPITIIKLDYNNGFKVIHINTRDYLIVKTNWELDKMKNGKYLPRIQ
ncbi:hypothetical protein K1Y24_01875 [Mammaliicoccus sciuri]|uniref:hypothetical protein n=1 Tax=Mammaliicoccus sciuri TaxID=1296 RepID=UPI001E51DCDE|nr:hypothetical protein [Mammaliicoccus sciuri]MCD8800703.1 hypothetical protein [Mammaliicoccus sciuri]